MMLWLLMMDWPEASAASISSMPCMHVSEVATMTSSMVWNNPVSSRPKPTPQDGAQRGQGDEARRHNGRDTSWPLQGSGIWNAVVPRVNQCQPTRHGEQQRRKKDMLRGCDGVAAVQVTGASPARGQPVNSAWLRRVGIFAACVCLSIYLSACPACQPLHPRKWAPSCIKHRRVPT